VPSQGEAYNLNGVAPKAPAAVTMGSGTITLVNDRPDIPTPAGIPAVTCGGEAVVSSHVIYSSKV
jgi:hypothetical protein